ncbi:MAG: UvrD-helicase domain-containing protein, partial [Planctomycetota bacterium]
MNSSLKTRVDNDVTSTFAPMMVRASAGSGKTYQLTGRYLRLLLAGATPESILATTFTRKAAGEILDRVMAVLARAADETQPAALEDLRRQVGLPTLPRSQCVRLLHDLLRNVHKLQICTLDSLFVQLTQSCGSDLGLPPSWEMGDEVVLGQMQTNAIAKTIERIDAGEISSLLSMLSRGETPRSIGNEIESSVRSAYEKHREAIAAKTASDSGEENWRVLRGQKLPDESELAGARRDLVQFPPTQKSLQKILALLCDAIDSRDFESLADSTILGNIRKAKRSNEVTKYGRSKFDERLNDAFDVIYRAVQSDTIEALKRRSEAIGRLLQHFSLQFDSMKWQTRKLGFSDVTHQLALRLPKLGRGRLQHRLDSNFSHVLLDEFQDTSPSQWRILSLVADRAIHDDVHYSSPDNSGVNLRSFFCVGDTKQAIYGWRGGQMRIFDSVKRQVPNLVENPRHESFRSSPVVIDLVNRIFRKLPAHPKATVDDMDDPADKSVYEAKAIQDFTYQFPEHVTARTELPGYAELRVGHPIEKTFDIVSEREQSDACYSSAIEVIKHRYQQDPTEAIAVLVRENRGVAMMIHRLNQEGLPASQEGGNPLTDSVVVEMVLSALMITEHPGDLRHEFHLSNTPLAGVVSKGGHLVLKKLEETGLVRTVHWLAKILEPNCAATDRVRLGQLVRLAIQWDANASDRLRDFVDYVRKCRVQRPQAAPIRVMTVHQSKGLEFDTVVLPELHLPLVRPNSDPVTLVSETGDPVLD